MNAQHIRASQLHELARRAVGEEPTVGGKPDASLGLEALEHLRTCLTCQANLAAASAALECLHEEREAENAGERGSELESSRDLPEDPQDLLDEYEVIDVAPCEPERSRFASPQLRLAAAPTPIAGIGPARDRAKSYRSIDEKLVIDVREDAQDDSCYVYLLPESDLDRTAIRLYVPPGLVRPWPQCGYFRYPRYTFDTEDWSDIKLLYPRSAGE